MADQAEIIALGESKTQLGGCGHVLRLVVTRQTGATSRACAADRLARTAPLRGIGRVPAAHSGRKWHSKMPESRPQLGPEISDVSRGTKRLGWGP